MKNGAFNNSLPQRWTLSVLLYLTASFYTNLNMVWFTRAVKAVVRQLLTLLL